MSYFYSYTKEVGGKLEKQLEHLSGDPTQNTRVIFQVLSKDHSDGPY